MPNFDGIVEYKISSLAAGCSQTRNFRCPTLTTEQVDGKYKEIIKLFGRINLVMATHIGLLDQLEKLTKASSIDDALACINKALKIIWRNDNMDNGWAELILEIADYQQTSGVLASEDDDIKFIAFIAPSVSVIPAPNRYLNNAIDTLTANIYK